jgi:hypothetical protein
MNWKAYGKQRKSLKKGKNNLAVHRLIVIIGG